MRCSWVGDDPLYQQYHDEEWGVPVRDDRRLFEKICLEGFQSGLSWITILRKRENFRRAFAGFDVQKMARFGKRDVDRLMRDAGIIRHRGKIESAINNARRALELAGEAGSLSTYFWRWNDAAALAKDLKRRGWTFVGPTTIYAFMQASGIVNDHEPGCAMGTEKNLETLIREMKPELNRGEWAFCAGAAADAVATFQEREGITSIVERTRARQLGLPVHYVAAWITLTVHSDLDAVGFLAAVTTALAAAGISCNVVSAVNHDHLFVPFARAADAMRVLDELSCSGSNNTLPTSGSAS